MKIVLGRSVLFCTTFRIWEIRLGGVFSYYQSQLKLCLTGAIAPFLLGGTSLFRYSSCILFAKSPLNPNLIFPRISMGYHFKLVNTPTTLPRYSDKTCVISFSLFLFITQASFVAL